MFPRHMTNETLWLSCLQLPKITTTSNTKIRTQSFKIPTISEIFLLVWLKIILYTYMYCETIDWVTVGNFRVSLNSELPTVVEIISYWLWSIILLTRTARRVKAYSDIVSHCWLRASCWNIQVLLQFAIIE